jgi:hypothetical protein
MLTFHHTKELSNFNKLRMMIEVGSKNSEAELAGVTIRSRCWFYKAKSRVIKSSMLLIMGKRESLGKSNYPDPAVVETNTQQGGR